VDIIFCRYRRKVESQMIVADRLSSFKEFGRKDWDEASIGVTVDPGAMERRVVREVIRNQEINVVGFSQTPS
jgi:hypothetical protein